MEQGKAIVFGGTGFLGRRVVQCLIERDFSVRVASRHPERTKVLFPGPRLSIQSIYADINDDRSVADALADIGSAVNAVSLYAESGQQTFHSVHVTAAARVARLAREGAIERFIHVSGIGSDSESPSPYIRSRGEEERVVREAFPAATFIRPSVMFGRGDAFVTPVAKMLRRLAVFHSSEAAKHGCNQRMSRSCGGDRQGGAELPFRDVLRARRAARLYL